MLVFNSGLWDGSSNSKCGTCSSLGSLEGRKIWTECIRRLLCLLQIIGKNHSRWKDDHYNEVCSTEKDVHPLFGPWKHWDKRIFRKVDKVALAVMNDKLWDAALSSHWKFNKPVLKMSLGSHDASILCRMRFVIQTANKNIITCSYSLLHTTKY